VGVFRDTVPQEIDLHYGIILSWPGRTSQGGPGKKLPRDSVENRGSGR
jgi:hypothetical protein